MVFSIASPVNRSIVTDRNGQIFKVKVKSAGYLKRKFSHLSLSFGISFGRSLLCEGYNVVVLKGTTLLCG